MASHSHASQAHLGHVGHALECPRAAILASLNILNFEPKIFGIWYSKCSPTGWKFGKDCKNTCWQRGDSGIGQTRSGSQCQDKKGTFHRGKQFDKHTKWLGYRMWVAVDCARSFGQSKCRVFILKFRIVTNAGISSPLVPATLKVSRLTNLLVSSGKIMQNNRNCV